MQSLPQTQDKDTQTHKDFTVSMRPWARIRPTDSSHKDDTEEPSLHSVKTKTQNNVL